MRQDIILPYKLRNYDGTNRRRRKILQLNLFSLFTTKIASYFYLLKFQSRMNFVFQSSADNLNDFRNRLTIT